MASKGDLSVIITAVDQASEVLERIKRDIGGIDKPAAKSTKSMDKFSKASEGMIRFAKSPVLEKMGKRIGFVGDIAEGAVSKMAGMAPALDGLMGISPLLGVGGVVAGMTALGVETARTGRSLTNLSIITGQSSFGLQAFGGAARMSGSSAEAMNGSLRNLGSVMNDARFGRNNQALMLFDQLGLKMRKTASGAWDSMGMLRQIADVIQKKRWAPETQRNFLAMLGIDESLMPMLQNGAKGIDELARLTRDLNGTMTEEQRKNANAFADSLDRLGIAAEGAGWKFADKFLPELTKATDTWAKWLAHPNSKTLLGGLMTGSAAGAGAILGGATLSVIPVVGTATGAILGGAAGGILGATVAGNGSDETPRFSAPMPPRSSLSLAQRDALAQESYRFWRSKGLSPALSAGMVANEGAESAFDARAIGDSGQAVGLFQWHPDRRAAIKQGSGIDVATASHRQQLEAAWYELTVGNERDKLGRLMRAQTPDEAAALVSQLYERPDDKNGAKAAYRAQSADYWQAKLGGSSPDADTPAPSTDSLVQALNDNTAATREHTQAMKTAPQGAPTQVDGVSYTPGTYLPTRIERSMPTTVTP